MQFRQVQLHFVARIYEKIRRDAGGVFLTLPVGFGKTVVALEVARRLGNSTVVVAPARLRAHWSEHARALGVTIQFRSHAWCSRRRRLNPAPVGPGLVIVDEAHRFRNPHTKRYSALARLGDDTRWLLLSATPVVRSLTDVLAPCAIFDARAAEVVFGGVHSGSATIAHLLQHGVIVDADSGSDEAAGPPPPRRTEVHVVELDQIDNLARAYVELSVPAALRPTFLTLVLRAACSSPGAFGALHQTILDLDDRAREAEACGVQLTRRSFYASFGRQIGAMERDQQVLPWFFDDEQETGGFAVTPLSGSERLRLETIAEMIASASLEGSAANQWLKRAHWGPAQLVFTSFRATVWWLRDQIDGGRWRFVDGQRLWSSRSGRLQREGWTAEEARGASIVSTDVLGVGFGFPWIERVVHLEEPWRHTRMIQREGRVTRSPGSRVDVRELYRARSLAGERAWALRSERRELGVRWATLASEQASGTRTILSSRPPVFHVKHSAQSSRIQKLRARTMRGQPVDVHHARTAWLARDWLAAESAVIPDPAPSPAANTLPSASHRGRAQTSDAASDRAARHETRSH